MSVFVGQLMSTVQNSKWKYRKSCHMFVDPETGLEALHAFAASIGLRRFWLHDSSMPHYDLTENKRKQALANGAIDADRKREIESIRKWRRRKEITNG